MKIKKLLSALLAMTVVISSFVALTITANAATTAKKTMNFGSSVISVRDNIYYGNQTKWRVLSKNGNTTDGDTVSFSDGTNAVAADKALFVISENDFGTRAFDSKHRNWQGSSEREWCNGTKDGQFYKTAGIMDTEKAAILTTNKSDVAYSNIFTNYKATENILNDKIFCLSAKEAETYFNSDNDRMFASGGTTAVRWWLRSQLYESGHDVGAVAEPGPIANRRADLDDVASRPAFNLNLESVLFTSAADFNGTIGNYEGNEWKLTLKDENRSGFEAKYISQDGNKIKISYSGAKTGINEKISYIITDKDQTEIKYYGSQAATSEDGNIEIALPVTVDDDRLFVFNEQDNGEKKTNYASEPVEVIIGLTEYYCLDVGAGAYIDTEFSPNKDTRVVMDCKVNNQAAGLFGSIQNLGNTHNFYVNAGGDSEYGPSGYGSGYGSTARWTPVEALVKGRQRVELAKNEFKVDGVTKDTHNYGDFNGQALYLFGIHIDDWTQTYPNQHIRFYSCQIYDNGNLVRDFVPAKKNDKFGVFDKKNKKFHEIKGNGTVNAYQAKVTEYFCLDVVAGEFIDEGKAESSEGAYINTGVTPTSNTRVVMEAEVEKTKYGATLFGVGYNPDGNNYSFHVNTSDAHYGSGFGLRMSWSNAEIQDRPQTIQLDNNLLTIDGEEVTYPDPFPGDPYYPQNIKVTPFTFDHTNNGGLPLFLFANNFFGNGIMSYNGQHIRFYSCKIYEGDNLVRDFVPATAEIETGVYETGVYDRANGKFYAIIGEGTVNCLERKTVEGKKPTCTDTGWRSYYEVGNRNYKDEDCRELIDDLENWKITPEEMGGGMLPKLAHNWTEAEENKAGESTLKTAATCTANEFYYKACADCDAINENETWEKLNTAGHHWENAEQNKAGKSTLKTAATCVSDAVYHKACVDCDAINKNETWEKPNTATGIHQWVTINGTEHKCTVCGATEEHHYQDGECTVCGRNENYGKYIVRSLNELNKETDESETDVPDTVIEITEDRTTLSDGWYIVAENVEISSRISVNGTAEKPTNIILTDGCTLTVKGGIDVAGDKALNIYGQTNDSGILLISNVADWNAGIGGTGVSSNGGTVTVYGGIVTATGGNYGAGIGGGGAGNGGNVTVYGGTVTATGGKYGAGIGGGYNDNGGTVIINGGTVTATGGTNAAGIGAGHSATQQVKNHGTLSVPNGNLTVKAGNSANDAAERTVQQYITDRNRYVYIGEKNKLSLEVDGNKFTVIPGGKDAGTGTIIVALYDSEYLTRLLDVKVFDLENGETPSNISFDQDGYVKAMWWSDLKIMTPLCEAKGTDYPSKEDIPTPTPGGDDSGYTSDDYGGGDSGGGIADFSGGGSEGQSTMPDSLPTPIGARLVYDSSNKPVGVDMIEGVTLKEDGTINSTNINFANDQILAKAVAATNEILEKECGFKKHLCLTVFNKVDKLYPIKIKLDPTYRNKKAYIFHYDKNGNLVNAAPELKYITKILSAPDFVDDILSMDIEPNETVIIGFGTK